MSISEQQRIEKNLANLKPLSVDKLKQLQEIELRAIATYAGRLDELESAMGFLRLGFQFGWKPLAIIHSKQTFRKYEQMLGINAREHPHNDQTRRIRRTAPCQRANSRR